jgi:2-deoxy-D-gluconate 3-dehydrogenase
MIEKGHGKIIFIASLLSFQGGINVPGYAAAKGGIASLTKALAKETAKKPVNGWLKQSWQDMRKRSFIKSF